METVKRTFVVEVDKGNQARIGRSSILQPKVHFIEKNGGHKLRYRIAKAVLRKIC